MATQVFGALAEAYRAETSAPALDNLRAMAERLHQERYPVSRIAPWRDTAARGIYAAA